MMYSEYYTPYLCLIIDFLHLYIFLLHNDSIVPLVNLLCHFSWLYINIIIS